MKDNDPKMNKQAFLKKGLKEGSRVAFVSFIILMAIGLAEVLTGYFTGSVTVTADGIDSISDAAISLVVFLGLRFSQRKPDEIFHFGYHKIETLAAFGAAIGMVVIGIFIVQHSIESLLNPHEIENPLIVMAVLGCAGTISLYRAFQMRKIANKYNLLSLKTDAKNSIKDGSASIVGLVSVAIATFLGFQQMDAIGGIIIAGYIFTVAYVAIKSSSLILVDANYDKNLSGGVKRQVESEFDVKVLQVSLRPVGPFFHCEIKVKVSGNMTVRQLNRLTQSISDFVNKASPDINHVTVLPSTEKA